jgi:integrase
MGNPNSPFLISLDGSSLTGVSARHWFYKILEASDIDYIPKVGPRIHDLRHTFAVHVLDKLVKEGVDMHCCLPVLSMALGHKCVSDTEYYVRITNQVYPHLSDTTSAISEYVFPTISTMK